MGIEKIKFIGRPECANLLAKTTLLSKILLVKRHSKQNVKIYTHKHEAAYILRCTIPT